MRRARGERESGVAGVMMGDVGDLVGRPWSSRRRHDRASLHAGFEERAVDDN